MKERKIVFCVVLTLGVLLFLTSCATTKTPLPPDSIDELLGTWVNPEYDGKIAATRAKGVFKEDGTIGWYMFIKSGNPRNVHYIDVKEKWTDRKGAVYFKAFVDKQTGDTMNVLIKIASDRKTLELLEASKIEFLPAEMDPEAKYCSYFVLYRQ